MNFNIVDGSYADLNSSPIFLLIIYAKYISKPAPSSGTGLLLLLFRNGHNRAAVFFSDEILDFF